MDFIFSLIELFSDFLSQYYWGIDPLVQSPFTNDLGVESDRSKQFSVGIFYFLVIGIIFFSIVAFAFLFKDKTKKIKTGEKILFAWIFLGLVVALIFGASQLLHGYLF